MGAAAASNGASEPEAVSGGASEPVAVSNGASEPDAVSGGAGAVTEQAETTLEEIPAAQDDDDANEKDEEQVLDDDNHAADEEKKMAFESQVPADGTEEETGAGTPVAAEGAGTPEAAEGALIGAAVANAIGGVAATDTSADASADSGADAADADAFWVDERATSAAGAYARASAGVDVAARTDTVAVSTDADGADGADGTDGFWVDEPAATAGADDGGADSAGTAATDLTEGVGGVVAEPITRILTPEVEREFETETETATNPEHPNAFGDINVAPVKEEVVDETMVVDQTMVDENDVEEESGVEAGSLGGEEVGRVEGGVEESDPDAFWSDAADTQGSKLTGDAIVVR
jgi:hypothetical protein